ncbi:MAG: helix-turn-helix transcriptional regulator [Bacteroidetes bacterium]|nr:helix-turn-helix transcriptional regulator [Bacteroidota bacterium]
MKDRIILLIKAKNYTAAQFADEIGVQKSGISHIISGRNNPSLDFVQKILQRFPEVNMDWLIMSKGPMFSSDSIRPVLTEPTLFTPHEVNIPTSDLFTTEISQPETPKIDAKIVAEPEKTEQTGNWSSPPEMEQKSFDSVIEKKSVNSVIEKNIPAKEEILAGNPKKVVKVLFFYSDKSFTEFYPES